MKPIKHIKQIKLNKKPRFSLKVKLLFFLLVFLLIGGLFNAGLKAINSWFEIHRFQFNRPVTVTFKPPIEIKEREIATKEIIKIIETIPAPEDLETDIEKYVYEKFTIENYRLALAIFSAESGLREDAYNVNSNGSIDLGVAQVNSSNWDIPGCSLKEIVTYKGNIDCAYILWDRADGKAGDKRGKFTPWTVFNTGAFTSKLK